MLTRYLYKKKDVENAFVASLLHPKSINGKGDDEPALFWAYELYYSGFVGQLIQLLWQTYYDFYVVAYVHLESYFKEYLQSVEYLQNNPKVIGIIVRNLLYNRPTLDVFLFMRGYVCAAESDINAIITTINNANLGVHAELNKVLSAVAEYVMVANEHIDAFKTDIIKYPLLAVLGMKRILIAICVSYKYMKLCEDEDDEPEPQVVLKIFKHLAYYQTVECAHGHSVLKMAHCCKDIRSHKECMGIVSGNDGHSYDTIAPTICHTPFWQSKIQRYGGQITASGDIIWEDDDNQTAFAIECDYDLEEQPADIQSMRVIEPLSSSPPPTLQQMQDFMNTYYEKWGDVKPVMRTIKAAGGNEEWCKKEPLQFTPVAVGREHPLKSAVVKILQASGKNEALSNWYIQIIDRFEFTEESLANINYKSLKKFIRKNGIDLTQIPVQYLPKD